MKYLALTLLLFGFVISGCSSDTTTNNNPTPTISYIPLTMGNNWKYTTPTGTTTHSVVGTITYNGTPYYIINRSGEGDSTMIKRVGTAYYSPIPDLLGIKDGKILDETLNASWSDTLALGLAINSYKITETGIKRTVNGVEYPNVIHVHMEATTFGFTASKELYYAKGVGMIEEVQEGTTALSLDSYHLN